ncbi:MAG TPA: SusC/RagA family TonB-linked outer membrane protein [Puia sp.]|nr:SusC/RagA family TonB-linked outer membrane protein [Puia sp.]
MTIQRLLAKLVSLALVCVLFTHPAFSQTKTITGKVVDDKGNPLSGVSVTVKGSRVGTSTDAAGAFTLNVKSTATTLVLTSVGFADKEVNITAETSISVSMTPSSTTLGDLVVTGYGTARKKDLTGAVDVVSTKDFNAGVVSNPMQQIQGKVSGLIITQQGGDPNQNPIIRLRGQTSLSGSQNPLYVVDGVTLDDPTIISTIPPGDIESYSILKDASAAAIYGSRGANGVIQIVTKRGHAGRAQVDYNGSVGFQKARDYWPLLNVAQWEAGASQAGAPDSVIQQYNKGGNTDWNKAVLRTAFNTNQAIGISGGSGNFNYRGSVNYTKNDGIVLNSGMQQVGLRFTAEQKAIDDKLDIQVGIVNSQTQRKYTDYGVFDYIFSAPPTYPIFNKDGTYYTFVDFEEANPVYHLTQEINKGDEHFTQMYGTVNFEIIKGLKLGGTGSLTYYTLNKQQFTPTFQSDGNSEGNVPTASQGSFYNNSGKGDIHVNYAHTWGDHNLTATAVYEYNNYSEGGFTAGGQQYIVPGLTYNNLGAGNPLYNSISSYADQYLLISYLGRVTYSFQGKYLATVTARRDGSSKFGVNNRYGTFPSFDLGWRISQEDFMRNLSWLNELKIRAGYGVTGNSDNIYPYSNLLLIGSKGTAYYNPSNSVFPYPPVYSITQNANPNLRWEQRAGTNIGFDFAILNNRVTGSFNYFNDKTTNLLYNYTVPTPPFFINTILANVGSLTNKGVEFQFSADVVRTRDFTWTLAGNISTVNTKVTSLKGNYAGYTLSTDNIPGGYAEGRGLSSNPITYLKVGYSPYVFYLPKFEGVDKNGNQLFDSAGVKQVGVNGNPTLYYVDPAPKFFYGINNTLTYKNFGLNFFLRGVAGQKIFNNEALDVAFINRLPGNNVFKQALTNGIKDQPVASTLWLEKAGYLRVDNVTLSYTIPKVPGFQSFRVYIAANNLAVITHYTGLDPEVRTGSYYNPGSSNNPANQSINTEAYIDAAYGSDGYYPKARSFAFGVNVTLNK